MLRANPKALVLSGISPAVTLQQSLLALQFSKLPYSCPNPASEEVHLPPHQFPQSASVYLHKPETNLPLPLFAPSFPFSEVKDGNTCWHRYTSNILSPWMQQWAASFPSPNAWIQNLVWSMDRWPLPAELAFYLSYIISCLSCWYGSGTNWTPKCWHIARVSMRSVFVLILERLATCSHW